MSGHSKWNNIKRKKEKTDGAKAKVFTKIGREISVAVRTGGPNPASNSKLADLIAKAKRMSVPNDNIQRIIKKAEGGDKTEYEAITYEGYGPGGVAVMAETLTDNRINYGPVLENIVYRYALAQGCKVSVGRIGKLECDFILRNPEMGYAYVQVAMTIMADRATEEREYRPFTQIKDNYPKYLLTRSDPIQRRDGIIHANIPEFMQEGRAF